MFDHVTLRVSDLAASEAFLETVLEPLGVELSFRSGPFSMWKELILSAADDEHPVTRNVHVGLTAPTREQVDGFWQAGVDAGHPDDGPPGPRPQYREDYYGAFLRDPDGNSIEAVVHGGQRPHQGLVDHLWIRVADLPASAAFYRATAAIAGFEERHAGEDRVTFAGHEGGSFSLVPGEPTAALHLAFAGDEVAVRRFHDELVALGHPSSGEPGERPQYHPGYFASYVLDPDGNNVELVEHHRG